MINFIEFCELLTHGQKYSYFLMPVKYKNLFLPEELTQLYIETSLDKEDIRVWYPRDKFYKTIVTKEQFMKLISSAMESGDWDEVKQLREKVKIT